MATRMAETTKETSVNDTFADIVQASRNFIVYLKKWGRTLLVFMLLGALSGVAIYFWGPQRYSMRVMLRTDLEVLNGVNQAVIANELQTIIKERRYDLLAEKMNISLDWAQKISRVDAEPPKLVQPETNNFLGDVYIYFWVKDKNFPADTLTAGLLHYLNHNSYIQEQLKMRKDLQTQRLDKIIADQRKLDSLRTSFASKISEGRFQSNIVMGDLASMYGEMDRLYQAEVMLKTFLVNNRIRVLVPFNLPRQIFPLDWYLMALIGAALFFVLGVTYIRFWKEEHIFG